MSSVETSFSLSLDPRLVSRTLEDVEIDLLDSSFFSTPGRRLPSAEEVRARNWSPKVPGGLVVFEELGVLVKFGYEHRVRIEEAQTLRAIRHRFPDGEVPVPEVFGWKIVNGLSFIYMSIIHGATLMAAWSELDSFEQKQITYQLRDIVVAL